MYSEGARWRRAGAAPTPGAITRLDLPQQELRRRLGVFLLVFGLVAFSGLIWVWARPPVYESHTLLQLHFDRGPASERIHHRSEEIAFHRELLTSRHLLNALSERMSALGAELGPVHLERMLGVSTLDGSRILHLQASAETAELPATLLREWEILYRQRFLEQWGLELRDATRQQDERIAVLERQQAQQKREFDAYQQVHSIVSIERDENRVLNRIKGLAASLDRAIEERQQIDATLESLRAAVRRGNDVVRPQDQRGIDNLEQRANDLEDQLEALSGRYTDRYLDINTQAVALQNRLQQVRESAAERRRESRDLLIEETQRQLDAAVVQVQGLETELQLQEGRVQEFNRQLYELRERSERLGQVTSELAALRHQRSRLGERAEPLVRVSLLEPPYVPLAPSRPHYWRDSGVVLGAALVAAIAVLLIYRTIVPGARPELVLQSVPDRGRERQIDPEPAPLRLSAEPVLSVNTCRALLESAGDEGRLTLMLLLSGVNLREIASLCWYHLNPSQGTLSVPSVPPRELPLPGRLAGYLRVHPAGSDNQVTPLLADAQGHPQSPDQLEALIAAAARAARLDNAEGITARRLELTYMAFLAEQGVGLQQLERQLGPLPADSLDRLEGRLPPGPERLLEEVNRVYPALA